MTKKYNNNNNKSALYSRLGEDGEKKKECHKLIEFLYIIRKRETELKRHL